MRRQRTRRCGAAFGNGYRFSRRTRRSTWGARLVKTLSHTSASTGCRDAFGARGGRAVAEGVVVAGREQYEAFMHREIARRQREYEERVIANHSGSQDEYDLEGGARCCETRTAFHVERVWAASLRRGFWEPNWRERWSACAADLNTRQRVIAARVRDHVRASRGRRLTSTLPSRSRRYSSGWCSASRARSAVAAVSRAHGRARQHR